ncbi:hypothetical protein ES707_08498 [subsurface metagenome]
MQTFVSNFTVIAKPKKSSATILQPELLVELVVLVVLVWQAVQDERLLPHAQVLQGEQSLSRFLLDSKKQLYLFDPSIVDPRQIQANCPFQRTMHDH